MIRFVTGLNCTLHKISHRFLRSRACKNAKYVTIIVTIYYCHLFFCLILSIWRKYKIRFFSTREAILTTVQKYSSNVESQALGNALREIDSSSLAFIGIFIITALTISSNTPEKRSYVCACVYSRTVRLYRNNFYVS